MFSMYSAPSDLDYYGDDEYELEIEEPVPEPDPETEADALRAARIAASLCDDISLYGDVRRAA